VAVAVRLPFICAGLVVWVGGWGGSRRSALLRCLGLWPWLAPTQLGAVCLVVRGVGGSIRLFFVWLVVVVAGQVCCPSRLWGHVPVFAVVASGHGLLAYRCGAPYHVSSGGGWGVGGVLVMSHFVVVGCVQPPYKTGLACKLCSGCYSGCMHLP